MKSFTSVVVALVLSMSAGCRSDRPVSDAPRTEFNLLHSVASGSTIRICGWFEAAYEVCSLSTSKGAAMFPDPRHIWVIPKNDVCDLSKVVEHPIGSWAELTGRLNAGEGQGHLGGYSYSLSDAVVRLKTAPCP